MDDYFQEKREKIRAELISSSRTIVSGKLERVSDEDLYILLRLYDAAFLDHYFSREYKGRIVLHFSRRLKSSAGLTKCQKNIARLAPEDYSFEILISSDFLFAYDEVNREIVVNGYRTRDALDALLLVFEHELCHVLEFVRYFSTSCKKKRFLDMARSLFGHTGVTHALPTAAEVNHSKYHIRAGDSVVFTYEGKKLKGTVSAVNKKAAVMVEHFRGEYMDKSGKRYRKFYVPIPLLNKTHQ